MSCVGQVFRLTRWSSLQHHLKKLEGRRLDFDYKKKRQGKVTEDEMKQAVEKFDDSKEIAEQSMFNLLESDVSWPGSPRLFFLLGVTIFLTC